MKYVSLIAGLFLIANMVQAQDKPKALSPSEKSNVTREYDEQGNLIRYDSTYVKSWSLDTAMNFIDMDEIQKEMNRFFGGGMPGMMPDSSLIGGDPFHDLQEQFFSGIPDLFNQFEWGSSDSTMIFVPDSVNSFPDFDKLREEMMNHFGQFFQNDSTHLNIDGTPGQKEFDNFFDPKEMEKIRKEFEQHFEQLNKDGSQKIGT